MHTKNGRPRSARSWHVGALALWLLTGLVPGSVAAPLRGIGIEEQLSGVPVLLRALDSVATTAAVDLSLWVRLTVRQSDLEGATGTFAFESLDARIDSYRTRHIQVCIALADWQASTDAKDEGQRRLVQTLAARYAGKVAAYDLPAAPTREANDARAVAFALRTAAIQLRSADAAALMLQSPGLDSAWLASLYREGMAAYSDGVVLPRFEPELGQLINRESPTASIVVSGVPLGEDSSEAGRRFLISQFGHIANGIRLTAYAGTPASVGAALTVAMSVADVFSSDLALLDAQTARLRVHRDSPSEAPVRASLYYSPGTILTYFVYWGDALETTGTVSVSLALGSGRTAVLRDPFTGTRQSVADAVRGRDDLRFRVPLANYPRVVEIRAEDHAIDDRVDVFAPALPTVEEIIFRHQQTQAVQDSMTKNYRARVRVDVHLRPSASDPGFDISTENTFFHDASGSEWEELNFKFNGSTWDSDRPAFPLMQPETVLSMPLDLRLNRDYSYMLEGVGAVGERRCYIVRFEPLTEERSLYRGRVWIDAEDYNRLKIQAVQTRLSGISISNEEMHHFANAGTVDGHAVFLLTRLASQQIYLVAGRNLLVERNVSWDNFALNAPGFAEERSAARAGNRVMLKQTDEGLRYFVKQGQDRIVSDQLTKSAKAFAMGVIYDPSLSFPLPIAGINVLDFDFLTPDTQLAVLFGGVFAAGNIQRAHVLGSKLDTSIDFFGIAAPFTDRQFGKDGEARGEGVMTIPLSVGLRTGYQFAEFQKVTANYRLQYDAYLSSTDTATDFVVPSSAFTHGVGAGYEYRQRGYALTVGVDHFRRSTWKPWGQAGNLSRDGQSYTKYTVMASKDVYLGPLQKVHADATYYGGTHEDRFSSYQFGMFSDVKIHGVPSAGVRFADVAMIRGAYSFNAFDQYRFDVFVDQGFGRTLPNPNAWVSLPGFGVGINTRGPRHTFLRLDVGKSVLPDAFAGLHSLTFQVMLLRPLK